LDRVRERLLLRLESLGLLCFIDMEEEEEEMTVEW
jgi:hypothetical protein